MLTHNQDWIYYNAQILTALERHNLIPHSVFSELSRQASTACHSIASTLIKEKWVTPEQLLEVLCCAFHLPPATLEKAHHTDLLLPPVLKEMADQHPTLAQIGPDGVPLFILAEPAPFILQSPFETYGNRMSLKLADKGLLLQATAAQPTQPFAAKHFAAPLGIAAVFYGIPLHSTLLIIAGVLLLVTQSMLCFSYILTTIKEIRFQAPHFLPKNTLDILDENQSRRHNSTFTIFITFSNARAVHNFAQKWVWPDYPAHCCDFVFLLDCTDARIQAAVKHHGLAYLGCVRHTRIGYSTQHPKIMLSHLDMCETHYTTLIPSDYVFAKDELQRVATAFLLSKTSDTVIRYKKKRLECQHYFTLDALQKRHAHKSFSLKNLLSTFFDTPHNRLTLEMTQKHLIPSTDMGTFYIFTTCSCHFAALRLAVLALTTIWVLLCVKVLGFSAKHLPVVTSISIVSAAITCMCLIYLSLFLFLSRRRHDSL